MRLPHPSARWLIQYPSPATLTPTLSHRERERGARGEGIKGKGWLAG
ncbi:MAG: hypothetical protein HZA00_11770 [Nitrospinae bacterium]|nr:hypothetical protein [Nitrospinota bacterium]